MTEHRTSRGHGRRTWTLPLIARFLDHLDGERNFSAHTIRSYAADLIQFCRFLGAGDLEDAAGDERTVDDLPPTEELRPPSRSTSAVSWR